MKNNIETIFTHKTNDGAIGELGIDKDAKLYWNKKPIVTEQKVTLQRWVNISIIIASFSTLVIAIFMVLQYYCSIPK